MNVNHHFALRSAALCRTFFCRLFLFLLALNAANASHHLPVLHNDSSIDMEAYLQRWQPADAVSFETVLQAEQDGKFQPTHSRMHTQLDTEVWYKLQFRTAADYNGQAIINFREFLYERLDVYAFDGQQWQVIEGGLSQPYATRSIDYRYMAVQIPASTDRTVTTYFRVQAFAPVFIVPTVQSPQLFFTEAINQTIVSVFITGVIVGLVFYLWTASRVLLTLGEKVTFLGFLLSPLLFIIFYDGHLFQLFEVKRYFYTQAFPLTVALWGSFALLFCQQFFALKKNHYLLHQLSNLLLLIILTTSAYSLLINSAAVSFIMLNIVGLVFLLLLVIGIVATIYKLNSGDSFLLAMILFISIAIVRTLISTDALPYTPHERSLVFGGWLVFTLLMCLTITRQLNATQSRQQQFELQAIETEAKEAARNQFLATMSHEIRTPANGVLGMAELLNESRLDTTQSRYVSILLNSAKELIAIINDILDLHKVATQQLELETLYFNLDHLVVSTMASFSHSQGTQRFKYQLQLTHPLPFHLKGDPTRLQQILRNLLGGVKNHLERGTITLQVRQIDLIDSQVTLEFSLLISSPQTTNQGLESLFTEQNHTDASIGLTICKHLITLMGGTYGTHTHSEREISIWFRLGFDIDMQSQEQLQQKVQKLAHCHLACIFVNPRFSEGIKAFFDTYHVEISILDYDLNLDSVDFSSIDVLLLSNATSEFTRPWLYAAQDNNVAVILFNHYSNNIISPSECADLGVQLVNPPYGISDVVQAIDRTLFTVNQDETALQTNHKVQAELRVLVAEDNPINTKVAQAMLERYGIQADFVTTGVEAVTAYRQAQGYDLILMDCEMPEMDGFEATQKIRNVEADQQLRPAVIYALTAYTQDDYKARCKIAGMNGVLVKPLQKALLQEVLQSVSESA